ncbi:MAG: transglutaminase domain-containing protein [Actinobacteria bacterium]|nr:transglutaminase domain-containing protein [Actinomycetota bacterium]
MPERRTADSAPAQRTVGLDWLTSGLLLVAVGTSTAALGSILTDVQWWLVGMLVATVVLGTAAAVRSFTRRRIWGSVGAVLATIGTVTLFFAPGSAILGFIPTFDTIGALHELEVAGAESIANQSLPADADQGIVYLLCLGVAAICIVLDLVAVALRVPAFAGIPLVVLLVVPSIVDPTLEDGLYFALTAAAFIALLLVRSRPAGRGAALGIGTAAVLIALIIPSALPPVTLPENTGSGGPAAATGLNPIITLGDDLRRGDPALALTYTTTQEGGLYLRLTALDDFTGASWKPSSAEVIPGNDVALIGAAPGLGDAVTRTTATTEVTVANVLSRWLPAPYAPTSITGLDGSWSWEPDALAVRTDSSNARNQDYEVQSVTITPSVDQLQAAGTTVDPGLERYLEIPDDLPPVVAQTALQVAGGAATNYDKAIALQSYFLSDQFTYSEDAPVENGYDGSGASVLAAFLEAKSGYCVHFSSAMASMARTLGIPARVAVGFTPGEPSTLPDGGGLEYRVSTHNLHAWPELYFTGIGWVRFEPTPGRGIVPAFAPLAVDDPATPDVDESVPTPVATSTPAPSTAPSAVPTDVPTPSATAGALPDAPSRTISWWWAVVAALAALLLAPAVVRGIRRSRRIAEASGGSAAAAWDELRDTADDLGLATSVTRTPRQLALDLAPHLDDRGAAALTRLRIALETEAFHDRSAAPAARDVAAVTWSLRRKAGPVRSAVAFLLPRSLFAGWLPEPSRPVE